MFCWKGQVSLVGIASAGILGMDSKGETALVIISLLLFNLVTDKAIHEMVVEHLKVGVVTSEPFYVIEDATPLVDSWST